MKTHHSETIATAFRAGLLGMAMVCFFVAAPRTHGENLTALPLYIHSSQPILNEFGERLQGDAGSPQEERALILVLGAENGIFPPNPDGSPHPDNPILNGGVTGIGNLTSPHRTNTGRFAVRLVNDYPEPGTKFFVRAFHAPTLEESHFYGDSQVMTVDEDDRVIYDAQIAATDRLVDPQGDLDDDGLPNWWEWKYFRGLTNAVRDEDYDGSGMTNWEEYIAGTNPTDPQSFLGITRVEVQDDGDVLVEWYSVPERRYRVQFREGGLTEPGGFSDATGDIITPSGLSQTIIPGKAGMDVDRGYFRVRVFRAE